MNGKTKRILGLASVLGVLSIAFFAAPIQAYFNGTENVDLFQDRLRSQDCNGNGEMLQTQERERLRTQDRGCTFEYTQTQHRNRERINECATNRVCNCTMSMEQHRHQYREQKQSQEQ